MASLRVFLARTFQTQDRDLVHSIDRLLSSHDVEVLTGDCAGGEKLEEEIRRRIEQSDGLVALRTRRDPIANSGADKWTTHQWVDDEYGMARSKNSKAVALVETGRSKERRGGKDGRG